MQKRCSHVWVMLPKRFAIGSLWIIWGILKHVTKGREQTIRRKGMRVISDAKSKQQQQQQQQRNLKELRRKSLPHGLQWQRQQVVTMFWTMAVNCLHLQFQLWFNFLKWLDQSMLVLNMVVQFCNIYHYPNTGTTFQKEWELYFSKSFIKLKMFSSWGLRNFDVQATKDTETTVKMRHFQFCKSIELVYTISMEE